MWSMLDHFIFSAIIFAQILRSCQFLPFYSLSGFKRSRTTS